MMSGRIARAARWVKTSALAMALGGVLMVSAGCGSAPASPLDAVAATETSPPTASATPTPTPVVTVEEEQVLEAVPFESSSLDDASLASGSTAVATAGVGGERTIVFRVTRTDGVETSREEISNEITRAPVSEVIHVGTYVEPPPPAPVAAAPPAGDCDGNYSGACVPVASDVDCEGGSGNGPAYVRGPVTVVGSDPYGLDSDGDGVGCES